VSDEIKISQIRMSLVLGEAKSAGCHLFHQLTLTSLSTNSRIVKNSDPPIELRQKHLPSALQDGCIALERTSFSSAMLLNVYKEMVSLEMQTRNMANSFYIG
jgi:hypothetical protein